MKFAISNSLELKEKPEVESKLSVHSPRRAGRDEARTDS